MSDEIENDIEDTDDDLESTPPEELDFWQKKQRELVTSVVDYNLKTLSSLIENKTIELSPKYQRRFRWDKKRQSKLIESFFMNVPVPPIYLNEDSYGKYSVIDGKQRLTSIHQFFCNELKLTGLEIFHDINGQRYHSLSDSLKSVISTRPTLRAVIILRQSDNDVKFEVFRRLNTGGVILNAQEIRNSAFPGPLNNVILQLSEHPEFHQLLGIKNKEKSRIYKEMRDAEFVLRYFTFKDNWEDFSGGMKRHMDMYMMENKEPSESMLEQLYNNFLNTIRSVKAGFNGHAFQRWLPDENRWKNQILAALYDAQMFSCMSFNPDELAPYQNEILEAMKTLLQTEEFKLTIDAATNTPSYFRSRIQITRDTIEDIVR